MTIKTCCPEDAAILADIGRETYEHSYRHLSDPEVMEAYLSGTYHIDRIIQELTDPNSLTFLISDEEIPAAFMKVNFPPAQTDFNDDGSMELQRIYVRHNFKGRGYGKALIEQAIKTAKGRHCNHIWLSVWQRNPEAVSFYEKMGFYNAGTRFFVMAGEKQLDFVLKYAL